MSRLTHLGCFATWAAAVIRAVVGAAAKRVTRNDLSWMDDHMLRDIGLTRHDVWSDPPDPLLQDRIPSAGHNRSLARPAARERSARAALRRLWAADSGTA